MAVSICLPRARASPTNFIIPVSEPPVTIQAFVDRVAFSRADMNASLNFGRSSNSLALPVTAKITEGICIPQEWRMNSTSPTRLFARSSCPCLSSSEKRRESPSTRMKRACRASSKDDAAGFSTSRPSANSSCPCVADVLTVISTALSLSHI